MTLLHLASIPGVAAAVVAAAVVAWAWRSARWQRLNDPTVALRLVLGVIGLALLWRLRIEIAPGVALQLCGVALLHALVGVRLAAVGGAFAALLAAAAGTFDLQDVPATFLRVVALPTCVLGILESALASRRDRSPVLVLFVVAIGGGAVASLATSLVANVAADGAWETVLPAALLVASVEAQLSAIGVGALALERPGWLDPRAGVTDPERLRVRSVRVPPRAG